MMKRGLNEGVFVVRLVLWLLSSRLGTLLICGSLSLCRGFPFINNFSGMTVVKREEVLKRWNREKSFVVLRMAFVMRNENSENPSWDAIGYNTLTRGKSLKPLTERPLEKGIIETTDQEKETSLLESLIKKGLKVIEDLNQKDLYKVESDVVIVGSGCGGGVAASVLASSGHKVIVI